MNIVTTIMQFITPMIANRIASSLGISNSIVNTAIAAALPAILAALAGKASTPTGAAALSSTLGQQDSNLLGNFASMLGGANQSALVDGGTQALSGLLGGSSTNALTGALAKFTGASAQQTGGLIGMLAPVVLGSLAQTQKSSGLDAGGLAKLLDGQKSNIAAAMPAGFSSLLGGTGLLDSIAGNLKPGAAKIEAPHIPMPKAPSFNWMPWAAGALALFGLFYAFKPGSVTAPKVAAPAVTAPAIPAIANATAAMDEAKKIFGGLTSQLGSIKDAATAQSALPQLTASSSALDGLTKLAGSLAPDSKTQLKLLVSATMPQLSPLVDTILKIPGAEAILKPVLDGILTKMTGLSKI
ncbi:MAG: DUF937 domain-containing protein [Hyphomicrobiaceae bacterium]